MKKNTHNITMRANNHVIAITHPDKILFPEGAITKQEVCEYYKYIAPRMIPYLKNKPLSMIRYVHGITGEGFYQKNAGEYFPDWIREIPIKRHDGGVINYVVCDNAATLIYLANQECLTFHPWLSTCDNLRYPDRIIIDLDPGSKSFNVVIEAAYALKKIFEDIKLTPYVMTTGSRGLHVVTPIKQDTDFDSVRAFVHDLVAQLVTQHPERYTLEMRKENRGEKLFLDIMRNAYAQTAVSPYAIRAHPGAPVATPLAWHELEDKSLTSQAYTIRTIFKRLESIDDPWAGMRQHAKSIKKLLYKTLMSK